MIQSVKQRYRYSIILLRELVITEFKLRYQGSVLGYLWSVLKPLLMFGILYFVFVYFLRVGGDIPNWPVSMLLGIVLWTFFAEITNNGLGSIVGRGDMIRKINFPKYVIVLASSISAFINLLLNFLIIGVFMVISGVTLSWSSLMIIPYIFMLFTLGIGLAFILSAVYVKLRDMNYIWEIIMQAMFYGSAVIYPIAMILEQHALIGKIILLSPVVDAIQGARHFFIDSVNPTIYSVTGNIWYALIPVAIVVFIAIFGAWYFKKKSPYFAENI